MSGKKQKNENARIVIIGTALTVLIHLCLTALYALLISWGRAEAQNAGVFMYIITAVSALLGGFAVINIISGTKLDSLLTGLCAALITVFVSMLISEDDINTYNILSVSAIFVVGSYIGALFKLGKSNKKIHKIHKK